MSDTQPAGTPAQQLVERLYGWPCRRSDPHGQHGMVTEWGEYRCRGVPTPPAPHAERDGERRAAAGPPPGTLDGPGVLGRALLAATGEVWTPHERHPDWWVFGIYRMTLEQLNTDRGPVREVLLVDPAAGRVLELVTRLVREHDRYDERFRAAYTELVAAVDALFVNEPAGSSTTDVSEGATSTDAPARFLTPAAGRVLDAARQVAGLSSLGDFADWRRVAVLHRRLRAAVDAYDRPTTGGDPDLGGVSTAEAEAGAERLTANLAAASRGLAADEPAPEPAVIRIDKDTYWLAETATAAIRAERDRFAADLAAALDQRDAARVERDRLARDDRVVAAELAERGKAADAARAELARLRELTADSIEPATIPDQQAKGWPDFHPEAYCHRCGRRNLSWYADSAIWNEVHGGSGPIWCPVCFAAAYEQKTGRRVSWRLAPHELPDEAAHLVASEAAMRHALAEMTASRDRWHGHTLHLRTELRAEREALGRLRDNLDEVTADRDDANQLAEGRRLDLDRARAEADGLRHELATARRDAAADALADGAGRLRRIFTETTGPRVAQYLDAMARGYRTGTRPVPGSPQPAPDDDHTTEEQHG